MRSGYSGKPCHGCGGTDPRPTTSVCRECRQKLTAYDALMAQELERKKDSPTLYIVPERAHWLPYVRFDATEKFADHPVRDGFWKLATVASAMYDGRARDYDKAPSLFVRRRSDDHFSVGGDDCWRLLRPSIGKAISELFEVVRDALTHAYNEGVQHGRSLLIQLNDGDLTPKDFERRITKEKS